MQAEKPEASDAPSTGNHDNDGVTDSSYRVLSRLGAGTTEKILECPCPELLPHQWGDRSACTNPTHCAQAQLQAWPVVEGTQDSGWQPLDCVPARSKHLLGPSVL